MIVPMTITMSGLTPPSSHTSLVQVTQAQETASKTRDRQKAADDRTRRLEDTLDLKVSGVEQVDAARRLPDNDSEEGDDDRRRHHAEESPGGDGDDDRPSIDFTA